VEDASSRIVWCLGFLKLHFVWSFYYVFLRPTSLAITRSLAPIAPDKIAWIEHVDKLIRPPAPGL
jgi:hypothetical protein